MKHLYFTLLIIFIISIQNSNCQDYCIEQYFSAPQASFASSATNDCTGEYKYFLIVPSGSFNAIVFSFSQFEFFNDEDNVGIYEYDPANPNTPGLFFMAFDMYSDPNDIYKAYTLKSKGIWIAYYRSNPGNFSSLFNFNYQTVNIVSQTYLFTTKNGVFEDGSGAANYSNNIVNKYVIKPSDSDFVELIFSDYSIYYGDYVSVYDGENESSPLLGQFIYPAMPSRKFRSTGPAMCLLFSSNFMSNGSGWTAEYQGLYNQNNTLGFDYDFNGNLKERTIILGTRTKSANAQSSRQNYPQEKYSETMGNAEILIFPNPTHGKLSVKVTGYDISQKTSINIYNLSGKVVKQVSPIREINDIDMSAYSNGMYVMRIIIGDKVSEWKIMKE